MTFELWSLLLGALLIAIALTGTAIARLPITAAIFYFAAGVALGPVGLGWVAFDPVAQSNLVERFAEVAVIVSLFTTGLKLRLPLSDVLWGVPLRLAFVSMTLTVGLITAAGVYLLGLPLGGAVLLGAVLAPTDPVLASAVQVRKAGDREPVRFSLTGEAGLNDGTAFPFVMLGLGLLGLHDLGAVGWKWVAVDVVWAIVGGLGIGAALGMAVGRLVLHLRRTHRESLGYDEFLALGLIGTSYGAALLAHAYGFLAVFAAGLALREIERRHSGDAAPEEVLAAEEAETAAEAEVHVQKAPAHMTEAVLGFNEQMDRLIEVALVLAVGLMLSFEHVPPAAWLFLPLLIFVIRPVAVFGGLIGSPLHVPQRSIVSWLGIRGIGSVYYLMYAVSHGVPEELARELVAITVLVVAVSIVLHGVTATPIMNAYQKRWRPPAPES